VNQREKDIEQWEKTAPNESHSETFADGAAYAREAEIKWLRDFTGYHIADIDEEMLTHINARLLALQAK
jgi:hypothetical protein